MEYGKVTTVRRNCRRTLRSTCRTAARGAAAAPSCRRVTTRRVPSASSVSFATCSSRQTSSSSTRTSRRRRETITSPTSSPTPPTSTRGGATFTSPERHPIRFHFMQKKKLIMLWIMIWCDFLVRNVIISGNAIKKFLAWSRIELQSPALMHNGDVTYWATKFGYCVTKIKLVIHQISNGLIEWYWWKLNYTLNRVQVLNLLLAIKLLIRIEPSSP